MDKCESVAETCFLLAFLAKPSRPLRLNFSFTAKDAKTGAKGAKETSNFSSTRFNY